MNGRQTFEQRDFDVGGVEIAERLQHPAIVRCHAHGVQGKGDAAVGWIAMEWVPGTDLSRYASPARLLPEPLVLPKATPTRGERRSSVSRPACVTACSAACTASMATRPIVRRFLRE